MCCGSDVGIDRFRIGDDLGAANALPFAKRDDFLALDFVLLRDFIEGRDDPRDRKALARVNRVLKFRRHCLPTIEWSSND